MNPFDRAFLWSLKLRYFKVFISWQQYIRPILGSFNLLAFQWFGRMLHKYYNIVKHYKVDI